MDTGEKGFGGLVGVSAVMQEVYSLIRKVAFSRFPVLITGETGTGKELVARSIHSVGPRRSSPFVPVDCCGLTANLMEAELFGHLKGSFTGAIQDHLGLLASAGEGTLFLDEVGELPLQLQSKLLRPLQEREVRAVGSTSYQQFKGRIVTATNRDLGNEVRAGTFREDLYFRLNVIPVRVPPLRERKQDIPLLVEAFIEKYDGPNTNRTISGRAMRWLLSYDWPGNVRELENVVQRLVYLSDRFVLDSEELLPSPSPEERSDARPQEIVNLEELERRAIRAALRISHGNKIAAAQLLGIGKTTLYRRLHEAI